MDIDNVELGATYRDMITGFTGIATGRVEYITGCNQVLLAPKTDKTNKLSGSEWIDLERLVKQKGRVLRLPSARTEAPKGGDRLPPRR